MDPPDDVNHLVNLYDNALREIVDGNALLRQRKCQVDQSFHGTIRTYKQQRDTEGIVSGC